MPNIITLDNKFNVYNLENGETYEHVPYKDQCQKDYFYKRRSKICGDGEGGLVMRGPTQYETYLSRVRDYYAIKHLEQPEWVGLADQPI